jgi:hypothetical protein
VEDPSIPPLNPCPCCGYLVFGDEPGSYEICEICFWEDDGLQLEFATTLDGGANRVTLLDAQLNYARLGACEATAMQHVRRPTPSDLRDPLWRPIDLTTDRFPDWNEPRGPRPASRDCLYYWRSNFWFAT